MISTLHSISDLFLSLHTIELYEKSSESIRMKILRNFQLLTQNPGQN